MPRARRGIARNAPWVAFYGTADEMGDLARVATTFRLIVIDADPKIGNFTRAQIATLHAGGRNTVVSYLDVGSCERARSYFHVAPRGLTPCGANTAAQLGRYTGYPDEVWMNPANPSYQQLILEHVAPRLAATGVDGFFLDNLELLEHGAHAREAPCDAACVAGGLALVRALRQAYPTQVIIMQNATSEVTRTAVVGGVTFPTLLDGISEEETYAPVFHRDAEARLRAWQALGLTIDGHPFSITTEDYVGSCRNAKAAAAVRARSRARGFSPYVTTASADQSSICGWSF